MTANEEEIEILFKKMMEDLEDFYQTDEVYQEDMKDLEGVIEVQWKICGMVGYQIFGKDSYSYKFGEVLDEPGVTFEIPDPDLALKFLRYEGFEFKFKGDGKGGFILSHTLGWEADDTKEDNSRTRISKPFLIATINPKKGLNALIFSKFPMFRKWGENTQTKNEDDFGSYIPINQSLGKFENQVLPMKIFKHFIDKACNIVVRDCPCRVGSRCTDLDPLLGCMLFGQGSLTMNPLPEDIGHVATKEEALDHVRRAIDSGLIPILGKSRMEAESNDVTDLDHFMVVCFCCSCCCINGKVISNTSVGTERLYERIEGLTVEVDPEVCVGCGDCLEVCTFKGMEMIDEKARVNQTRCLGCGRCESTCPNGAISIELSDPSHIDELIKKLEAVIDVT